MLSKSGEIRRDETCLDYAGQEVILYPCHGSKGNQFWQYNPDVSVLLWPITDDFALYNAVEHSIINIPRHTYCVVVWKNFNLTFILLNK